MMQKEILISIVVAVYNMEKYLCRCLDSLKGQSAEKVEYILIDDGSRDSSLSICQQYAEKDSRFCIVHKENGGVSSVRNMGVDIAKGQYIWFVDSDDWISDGSIAYVEQIIAQYSPDAVQVQYQIVSEETKAQSVVFGTSSINLLKRDEVVSAVLREELNHYMCGYIFNKKIYEKEKIHFPEGRMYEDTAVIPQLLLGCNVIAQTSEKLYRYFQHAQSATHVLSEKNLLNLSISLEEMTQIYSSYCIHNDELSELCRFFSLNCYIQLYILEQRFSFQNYSVKLENQHAYTIEQIDKYKISIQKWRGFRKYSLAKHYLLYRMGILKICLYIKYLLSRR